MLPKLRRLQHLHVSPVAKQVAHELDVHRVRHFKEVAAVVQPGRCLLLVPSLKRHVAGLVRRELQLRTLGGLAGVDAVAALEVRRQHRGRDVHGRHVGDDDLLDGLRGEAADVVFRMWHQASRNQFSR